MIRSLPTARRLASFHRPYILQRQRYHPSLLNVVNDKADFRSCHILIRKLSSSSSSSSSASGSHVPAKDTDNNPVPGVVSDNVDHLPEKLIDFEISCKIEGKESQVATIQLQPGEMLRAEAGAMLYMTEGVVMDTKLNGVSSAFSRMLTGQNLFLTDFMYEGTDTGTVCLGTDFPSKILRLHLPEFANGNLVCQKGAYMASNPSVNIEMEFTKTLSAGFFGGQGFVLQKLSGPGDVLIKGGGTIVQKELEAGQTLRVTTGSLVCFESSCNYDIQMMPGIKNVMFGGEGLFVTTLQGPGKVWLQGMPPARMIAEIARRVPSGGIGLGVPIGMGGGGGEGSEGGEAGDAAAAGAADEAAAGTMGAAGTEGMSDAVAAEDSAINADRQATVASSGMMGDSSSTSSIDADSPEALFGDALPDDADTGKRQQDDSSSGTAATDDTSFTSDDSTTTTFKDDDFSMPEEPTFDDDIGSDEFSSPDSEFQDGELFDDGGGSDGGAMEDEGSGASEIFSTLWDLFTGGRDD